MNLNNLVIIFLLFQVLAVLTGLARKDLRPAPFLANLALHLLFLLGLFKIKEMPIMESMLFGTAKWQFLLIITFLEFVLLFLNRGGVQETVKNGLVNILIYIGVVFSLGATDLMTLFISMELLGLLAHFLLMMSNKKNAIVVATKSYIFSLVMSVVFFLAIVFFYAATGKLGLQYFIVSNHHLYAVSVALFLIVLMYRWGIFPFHSLHGNFFLEGDRAGFSSYFLIINTTFIFNLTFLLQNLLVESVPDMQEAFIHVIEGVAVINALCACLYLATERRKKRLLYYSFMLNLGGPLLNICLLDLSRLEGMLALYLVFQAVVLVGLFWFFDFGDKYCKDNVPWLLILLWNFLSLPGSIGLYAKYMFFTNFVGERMFLPTLFIMLFSAINLLFMLKMIVQLIKQRSAFESSNDKSELSAMGNFKVMFIILCALIATGGIFPTFFLKYF